MMSGLLLGTLCPWCAQPASMTMEGRCVPCNHIVFTNGAPTTVHRIELPFLTYPDYPKLHANLRGNRWEQNRDVQAVRHAVATLARHAQCRPGRHVTVHLAWSPKVQAGQDADNLWPLFKACCDGLARGPRRPTADNKGRAIGLDLVPDDSPMHMTKLCPVILPKGDPPGMWLTVIIHGGGGDENPRSN